MATGEAMRSDWYKTRKSGTFLIVPAEADPLAALVPADIRDLLDRPVPQVYALDVDSCEEAARFDFVGVDSCLVERGYCVLRS